MGSWQRELIRLVRERPSLYDKEDQYFHDTKNMKLRKWQEIADELNKCGYVQVSNEAVDSTFVQKKWRNIRDNFVKNINRYNEQCLQSGPETVGRPRFSYWKEMRWILPFNKQAASISEEAMNELMKYMDPADDPETEELPDIAEVRAITTTFNSDDILSSSSVTTAAKPTPTKPTPETKPRSSLKRKIRDLIKANEETKMNSTSLQLSRPEVTEDRLFGQLVERRLSAIPAGAPKERLKVDMLRMLCNTQYPTEEITFVTTAPAPSPPPTEI